MTSANTVDIANIKVGIRHRRDMGDLAALRDSIAEHGLLHPIVVTPSLHLIAGERRLKACTLLGWTEVPITIVDLDEIARGERDENFVRKDFTPSEAVAIAEALMPKIKAEAKARQRLSPGRGKRSGNLPDLNRGETRDKVAAFTGIAPRTLNKAVTIVQALRADPDNERIQKIHADMDRTGNVHGPFKRLKVMQQSVVIRAESPPLPNKGPYRVIVADPPWPYELRSADPKSHTITLGFYEDGALGEVFINGGKSGEVVEAIARDGAVLLSLALQYGAELSNIRSAITRDEQGAPSSIVGAVIDRLSEAKP